MDGSMSRNRLQRTVSMKLAASPGAELVLSERDRQIFEEKFSPGHDDEKAPGILLMAAACYAEAAQAQLVGSDLESYYMGLIPEGWPWEDQWWKPSEDPVRNLVKAGALITAEIDRILRRREKALGMVSDHGLSVQDGSTAYEGS